MSFGAAYDPPESDGSGSDRTLLRKAIGILESAGCKRQGSTLLLPDGKPLDIEFLDYDGSLEPHTGAFIRNLRLLGIDARYRIVDAAQYKRRTDDFDFDIVVQPLRLRVHAGRRHARLVRVGGRQDSRGRATLCGIADPGHRRSDRQGAGRRDTRESLTVLCKDDRPDFARRALLGAHVEQEAAISSPSWDLFGRPAQNPKYGLNPIASWWYDDAKAKATALNGH